MKNEFSESYGNYAILPQVEMCLVWLTDEAETVALYVLLSFTLFWSFCMLVLAFYLIAIRKKVYNGIKRTIVEHKLHYSVHFDEIKETNLRKKSFRLGIAFTIVNCLISLGTAVVCLILISGVESHTDSDTRTAKSDKSENLSFLFGMELLHGCFLLFHLLFETFIVRLRKHCAIFSGRIGNALLGIVFLPTCILMGHSIFQLNCHINISDGKSPTLEALDTVCGTDSVNCHIWHFEENHKSEYNYYFGISIGTIFSFVALAALYSTGNIIRIFSSLKYFFPLPRCLS